MRIARRSASWSVPLLVAACLVLPIRSAHAAFSGTNGLVAYTCGTDICTVDADGSSNAAPLISGATDPAWSADGTKLAYVETGVGIAVVTVSGGSAGTPTTLVTSATVSAPTWSPDGTEIAYADGGSIKKVSSSGGTPATVDAGPNDADPAWSPDGTQIAFARQISGHYDIMVGNADGSGGTTPLTSNGSGDDRHPNWSPDGSLIVYSSSSGGSPLLFDMNSDGSAQTKLGPSGGVQGDEPAFSPDGSLIVFATTTGLETLDDTAGTPSTFVSGAGLADPDWQPISNTISTSGPPQIVTYPVINLPSGFDAPQLGLFLTTNTGTWSGKTPITFKYQWTKCDDKAATKPCYDIAGATSSFFTPTPDLIGWDISVTVTATNDQGSLYVRALPTKPVTGAMPVNHGSPRILGQNAVGSTLTSDTGVWRGYFPIAYAYQWERCDPFGTLTTCVPIAGATTSAYALQPADLNQTIRVFVTATNAVGSTTQFSNHTFPTLPKPKIRPTATQPPIVTGEPRDGSTLVLVQGTWTGDAPMQYAIYWLRCDATGDECVRVPATARKADRYLLGPDDVGATIVAAVVATNDGGATQVRTDPTDAVVSLPPALRHGRHLVGGPGGDYLAGSGGNDVIVGGAGNDTIKGGSGDDKLTGGAGNDVIDGGPGTDTISAGPGSDTVLAADGTVDTVDCGPGNDRAVVDSFDKVRNCEVVTTPSSSGSPAGLAEVREGRAELLALRVEVDERPQQPLFALFGEAQVRDAAVPRRLRAPHEAGFLGAADELGHGALCELEPLRELGHGRLLAAVGRPLDHQ